MKKAASLLLCLAIFLNAVFSFSLTSFGAESVSKTQIKDSTTYYEYNGTTQTLTISGTGDVPSFSNNSSDIPWYDLRQSRVITNVVVEEGITGVGNYFMYQVKAESISLPATLMTFGQYSFAYSTGITNLNLNFGVTSIPSYAFSNCSKINSVTLPKTLKTISSYAFQNCTGITAVSIPYDVSSIGSYAFSGCSKLSDVEFQSLSAPISISTYAFLGCSSLMSVKLSMRASVGLKSFGFNTSSSKNTSFKIYAFSESDAQLYAQTNSFSLELIDKIPMQCAVYYRNEYNEYNLNKTFCYEFTPDMDTIYNFYSRGDADLRGVLKNADGETLYENDDILAFHDLNFSISASLTAGETYYLYVTTAMSEGEFFVTVYPNNVRSMTAFGNVEISAGDYTEKDGARIYEVTDDMLVDNIILEMTYSTGLTDKLYYTTDYFNRREFSYTDTQSETPFTCGINTGRIKLGNYSADLNVVINHSYETSIVYPTTEEQGYTVYTCVCCGDTYNSDYVQPYVTAVHGNVVLAEDKNKSHSHSVPYSHCKVIAQGREYNVEADGSYTVYLSYDGDIEFVNSFGEGDTISMQADEADKIAETVVLDGCDLNGDGVVNAKDYALSIRDYKNTDIKNYFSQYGYNFYL